jgi:uncharacterized protein (TIGR02147 family)
MANLFEFNSYKEYLREILKEKKTERGFQAKLAKSAGCQASYLAQALTSKVELTPDHGMGISRFLGLGPLETEYFLNLLHYSRASSRELKAHLERKMEEAKNTQQILSERVTDPLSPKMDIHHEYYSSWMWMAIHAAVEIEKFSDPESIVNRFGLPREKVLEVLESLQRMGLVEKSGNSWRMSKQNVHLSARSFMNGVSHRNWRDRACADVEKERANSLHYTSVFTVSRSDAERIRSQVLQMIEASRKVIQDSPSEEVFCMLCDLFEV